jgi:hypothetical protein
MIPSNQAAGFLHRPWVIEESTDGSGSLVIKNTEGRVICTCHPSETMLADARVLAAAPELLDGVEELLHHVDWSDGAVYCPSWRGAMHTAGHALTKAAGTKYEIGDLF